MMTLARAQQFAQSFAATNGRMLTPEIDLVAGYGSLRGLPQAGLDDIGRAVLPGYTKTFNVVTRRARGTPSDPGRVLGLKPAKDEISVALFRIRPEARVQALAGLFLRELDGLPYRPRLLRVEAPAGPRQAIVFVPAAGPDTADEPIERTARIIATASGLRGTNRAYFDVVNAFDAEVPELRSAELVALERLLGLPEDGPSPCRSPMRAEPRDQGACPRIAARTCATAACPSALCKWTKAA